jgi:cell division protein FtsI/penicillin-binding protein 2
MQIRLKILGVLFALLSIIILFRLFYWQVLKSGDLSTLARSQYLSEQKIPSQRGDILASDGSWLASSTDSWLVYAHLPDLKDPPRTIANELAPFFVEDQSNKNSVLDEAMRLEGLLQKEDLVWVPLKRKINSETKKNIEAMNISGIGFDLEEARVYPESSSSAHLLGFVGKDEEGADKGYFGLEGYYDLSLSGVSGYVKRESNALGVPLLSGEEKDISALKGVNLLTHIDKSIQLLVEKKLKEGLEKYGASAGTVIVERPEDGAILAMASFPSYDPANYFNFGDEYFKNPSISDSFEPGSIFKPVIMVSALDAGVVEPDTKCDICDKPFKVDKYEISTWNNKYHPDSTMTDVIKNSDNVGMVFVGNKLGSDKLYSYLDKFGFGKLTGIDLQGEAAPTLRKKGSWSEVDLATTSFGQGIAVTPIQMISAITTIARRGTSVKPEVVDKISLDTWQEDIKPEFGKRVVSEKAAKEITDMMVVAVSEGEAKWAAPKGFKIAGKTGTAQIPVSGHYDSEKTIGSFVGFAPADKPKLVMLVTLREPQSSPWASETAAPLWFDIAKELFPYLGVQPEN